MTTQALIEGYRIVLNKRRRKRRSITQTAGNPQQPPQTSPSPS